VLSGRVGDSPIIGAGTYCTSQVAVSLTGVGERILVHLSAKRLCDLMTGGASLEMAGNAVMKEIEALAAASAGLIAIDAGGAIVTLWDTPVHGDRTPQQRHGYESVKDISVPQVTATLTRTLRTTEYFTLAFGAMVGVGWLVVIDDWLVREARAEPCWAFF